MQNGDYSSYLRTSPLAMFNWDEFPQMMGMQHLAPIQTVQQPQPVFNQLSQPSQAFAFTPYTNEVPSTTTSETLVENTVEEQDVQPEQSVITSLQKTRRKHMTTQSFTTLISDLTILYWSTTVDPKDQEDRNQQEATMVRLNQLSAEFQQRIHASNLTCNKLEKFVQDYNAITHHLNPYIVQSFLAAETIKSAQKVSSRKRQRTYKPRTKQSTLEHDDYNEGV